MKIDILTLFPNMFSGPFDESIVKTAQDKGLVKIKIHNLRAWTKDKHHQVDDRPYGGGIGMILMVEPIYRALHTLKIQNSKLKAKTILLGPCGKKFDQNKARELSKLESIILIAGHYEDVDQRVRDHLIDEELSIGDYILTGGELPAMVITDSIVRLIPGVLEQEAISKESFSLQAQSSKPKALLDFPQYTRPESFRRWKVPKILLSGNHKKIDGWRIKQAIKKTKKNRPDLLK